MIQLLSNANIGLQNVYVPLPFKAHLIFCIAATIVYALEFYRKKSIHYIFIAAAVDATLLMQFFPNSKMVAILAVLEAILLCTAITLSVKHNKMLKAKKAAQDSDTSQDEPENAEKASQTEDKKEDVKEDKENENSDT